MEVRLAPNAGDSIIQQIDLANEILASKTMKVRKVTLQLNDGLKEMTRVLTKEEICEKIYFSYID